MKFQWPVCSVYGDVMLAFLRQNFMKTKTFLNSCLTGLWLTNVRKKLSFLIRTDVGLFLMQMITSNSTLSHNSAKNWFWLYGVARKHPFLNVGEKIFCFHGADFLELCILNFRIMCELNIFIKSKIKGFGSLEKCISIKNCWLTF